MKKVLFTVLAGIVFAMPGMTQEFDHQIEALITGGGYELEESIPATKINSFADLINKRPAMPTVNDLITPEAKTAYARRGASAYYLGALNFRSTLLEKQQELNSKTLELGKMLNDASFAAHSVGLPTNKLEDLFAQIIDGWHTSAECKRAIQIEDPLAERLENWECCKNAKEGQTICYPGWWIEGRKSENALIDAYNRKQAEKWLAEVKAYDAQLSAMMKRLIELDNQLEQIRNGGEITAAYAMAKSEVYIAATNLYDFNSILELALQFPHVARQEESHCWTFFIKG